jgi:hypothetical protein
MVKNAAPAMRIRCPLIKSPEADYILFRQQQRKEVVQCLIVIICGP